ncbi:MAG: TlpA disulfide reductase family protein, partial [Eubacteriales bacterium]
MKKALIALVLLLTVFLVSASAENAEILGHPFPDFTVTDTQGNTFTLSEALKDHEAVLINIWATWCPPCEAEMPMLNEVCAQYGDQVAFIALSYDADDTVKKVEAYREDHGITFPMGRDEGASLYQYLSRQGVPTTVI